VFECDVCRCQAFKTGTVDLKPEAREATEHSITIPENTSANDFDLPPIPTQMNLDDLVGEEDAVMDPEVARGGRDSWAQSNISFGARKADITLADADAHGINEFGGLENAELLEPSGNQSDWFAPGPDGSIDDIELARKEEEGAPEFEFEQPFDASMDDGMQPFADKQARESDAQGAAAAMDDISVGVSPADFGRGSVGDFDGNDITFNSDGLSVAFNQSTASEQQSNRQKRRRVQLDAETEIKAVEIKKQLSDTSDIVREFELAPCTRKELREIADEVTLDFDQPLLHGSKLAPQLLRTFRGLLPTSLEEDYEAEEAEGGEELFEAQSAAKRARRSSRGGEAEEEAGADVSLMMDQQFDDQQLDFEPLEELGGGDAQQQEQEQQQQQQQQRSGAAAGELGEVADLLAAGDTQLQSATSDGASDGAGAPRGGGSADVTRSGWSKRTEKMLRVLQRQFEQAADDDGRLEFLGMLGTDASRKTAATTFFELLVLKSTDMIEVEQPRPFGEIHLARTQEFVAAH
jgi:chromatin segregation and condensation protein Rec8/ScpA/Scc1 (kleisin family)